MTIIYIIIMVETLLLLTLSAVVYFFFSKTNHRIANIEKNIRHLSTISQYSPDSNHNGEGDAKNTVGGSTQKQDVLDKLISSAGGVPESLDTREEKIKVNKMDKETINKILILVNQGFTPTEIAPKLNIPIGEIELVTKLRQYLNSPLKERL
jgi:hypothetical protein